MITAGKITKNIQTTKQNEKKEKSHTKAGFLLFKFLIPVWGKVPGITQRPQLPLHPQSTRQQRQRLWPPLKLRP